MLAETENVTVSPVFTWLAESWDENRTSGTCRADTWMVPELAKAAVAAGADGLMIEVHNNPAKAKCDGAQSLTPDQFDELMQFIGKEVEFFGKKLN